jgi:O-antigen/teichoic acid export membrane protein
MDRHGMRGSSGHGGQGKPGRITAAQATSTLWRNTSWNLLGTGLPMLLALITVPILIHGAGIERFGVLTIAWAILEYFGLFDLGVGRTTIKFLAESFEHDRAVESREIFWTTVLLSCLFGLLGGLILVALTPWLVEEALNVPTKLQTETRGAFYLLALGVPLTTTTLALRGTLEAKHHFRLVNTIQVPNSALTQVAPLLALLFGRDLRLLVGAMLLSRLCGASMFLVSALRNLEHPLRGPFFSRKRLRTLFSYSSWQGVTNTISPLMETGDKFVVGALSSLTAVAYYATPAEVIKRLLILPASVGRTTFPIFSAGISIQERTRVCIRAVKRLAMILAPLAATIIVFATDLLSLWVGPSFAHHSAPVLQILAVGLLANSLAFVPFGMIQGLGRPDVTAKFHLLELPIFFLLLWYGVLHWGIVGAATAWTARVGLDLGLLTIYTGRTKRVDMRIVAEEDLRWILGLGLLLLAAGWLLQELIAQPLLKFGSWGFVLCVVAYIAWHKALTVEEQTRVIRRSKKLAQIENHLRKRVAAWRENSR